MRYLKRGISAVAMGVVTSYAVALCVSVRATNSSYVPTHLRVHIVGNDSLHEESRLLEYRMLGCVRVEQPFGGFDGDQDRAHIRYSEQVPRWVYGSWRPAVVESVTATGWPFLAARYWTYGFYHGDAHDGPAQIPIKWRELTLPPSLPLIHVRTPVPLVPIWPGLFANTAIYGSAWFALLVAPGVIRGQVRMRLRGRCPACGYDLLHKLDSGCPECGWNRSPAG